MNKNYQKYELFDINKKGLIKLLDRGKEVLNSLGMKDRCESINVIKNKLEQEEFKVIILGEFKRGKSTFINSFLGEEVLPAKVVPCTAVINEVKWGRNKKAILHFKNPLPKKTSKNLPKDIERYMNEYKGREIPPINIDVNDINKYVTISDPGKPQEQSVSETPYSKVEIFWPLKLCENGITIIDSPGLNEHRTRTETAINYLNKVDAAIFVISVDSPISSSEMNFIESTLYASGHEYVFFICNKFDLLRSKNEKQEMKNYFYDKLGSKSKMGESSIFFLSGRDGLEGRMNKDGEKLEASGMLEFEDSLSDFLINKRGKIKLLQPAKELSLKIHEIQNSIIPAQRKMLESKIEDIKKKYEEVQPKLDQAERQKNHIIQRINLHRQELRDTIEHQVENKLIEIANEIPKWVNEIDVENSIKFFTLKGPKQQIEALTEEVVKNISGKIELELAEWHHDILNNVVEKKLNTINDEIEQNVEDLYLSLDDIKMDFSCNTGNIEKNVSGMERLGAAIAGFLLVSPGSAVMGAQYGFSGLLKSILPQIGLAFLAGLLGFTNPITLLLILLGGGLVEGLIRTSSMTDKTKKNIALELSKNIKDEARDNALKAAHEVYNKTEELSTIIASVLDSEIQSVRDMVETVLEAKNEGEKNVQSMKANVDKCEQELNDINNKLVNFITSIAM